MAVFGFKIFVSILGLLTLIKAVKSLIEPNNNEELRMNGEVETRNKSKKEKFKMFMKFVLRSLFLLNSKVDIAFIVLLINGMQMDILMGIWPNFKVNKINNF